MSQTETVFSKDLSAVVVGETAISDVQGNIGLLSYRGIDVTELANKPFLQVVWLVLFGQWPDAAQENQLAQFMSSNSELSSSEIELLKKIPRDLHPMLMLQGMMPLLTLPAKRTTEFELDAERGLTMAAKIPALIAGHYRLGMNKELVSSTPGASFHQNFLTLFHGEAPAEQDMRMLDTAQILQLEHSFNCGTFAGRVCASTLAPIQSCISASIGTLFGRLHGGADQAALEMAMQIGSADKAAAYVENALANKQKIMGMGHREYRTVDPRAKILKPMAVELCQDEQSKALLATLVAVEDACQAAFAKNDKQIWANVEFYKGAVFHSLGIPTHYFTAMFAMSRVFGYIAHYLEFSKDSCLIRPKGIYRANS
ncbi:MAG: citrate synthase [Halioglobus sp.]|jgi:citrate synthase